MPSEPVTSRFKDQIRVKSYPAEERGGLIWVYMGPNDKRPELPHFEWFDVPDSQRTTRTSLQDSNWLQSLEGDIDTAHVSFLHRWLDPTTAPDVAPQMHHGYRHFVIEDTAPKLSLQDTEYGFVYGGRRSVGPEQDQYYWRLSHWIAPCGAAVPGNQYRPLRFLVPIDDEHAMSVGVSWHESNDLTENPLRGPLTEPLQPFELPDGYVIDVHLPQKTKLNDFQIDREAQRTRTFTGISGGPQDQDRAMTETMESILDRSDEHLGTTDIAIVSVRRSLLMMAEALQNGIEPAMASCPGVIRTRGLDLQTSNAEFDDVLEELSDRLVGKV
jgi:phenylpropionate dioxygenase-like ring-hydroxylating dioxygenase large terminal subunit